MTNLKKSLTHIFVFSALVVLPAIASAALPELPRVYMDTTYSPPGGSVISVPAGGDFQAALNNAQPGSIIELQAGATYQASNYNGDFILPNKSGSSWIYIRSSAYNQLPPPGTRADPSDANLMPKIVGVSPDGNPAISAASGASHYRFVGVEIRPQSGRFIYDLVQLGGSNNIVFDRSYIHGDPAVGGVRGFAANGEYLAVIDSYVSDFKTKSDSSCANCDTQAIWAVDSRGPLKIVNNYLEASGENVMFGGSDPVSADTIPRDIEIRHNHFSKPTSWRGVWFTKNLLEFKLGIRVLVEGNVFENLWSGGQGGWAIVETPRNQYGGAPWAVVEDITFRKNIVRHSAGGVFMFGKDDLYASQNTNRLLFQDNLFYDISEAWDSGCQGACGKFSLLTSGALYDAAFDHNTVDQNASIMFVEGASAPSFAFTNNMINYGGYGFSSDKGGGNGTFAAYFPGISFQKNVLVGGDSSYYSNYPNNYFPSSAGYVNQSAGDYRLSASSPYNNAGTDGRDIGADIDAVMAATAGVTSGSGITPPPPPPSTKKGDLNNDSRVDVTDLGIFLSNWGKTTKPPADLNQDGRVDVIDLGILLSNWG